MDVRKPPTQAVFKLHEPQEGGKCRWCGQAVLVDGRPHPRLRWHPECLYDFKIITLKDYARAAVFERDHGICADCDGDFSMPVRYRAIRMEWTPDGYPYSLIAPVYDWQVEHHIPLWKVASMPPLQRLEYFRLKNLKTRCTACHAPKSAAETSERAHGLRLASGGRKRAGRPMRSRGFDKRFTRKLNGKVERRA